MERTKKIEIKKKADPGNRSKYKPEFARMGYEIALLCGASDRDLARVFDVSSGTIVKWRRDHPEFGDQVLRGKDEADAKVAVKLIERCLGYEHVETDIKMYRGTIIKTDMIKHYPPDVNAIKFWLTNRQKENWTETRQVEKNTNIHIHKDTKLDDIATEELDMAERLGMKKLLKDIQKKN